MRSSPRASSSCRISKKRAAASRRSPRGESTRDGGVSLDSSRTPARRPSHRSACGSPPPGSQAESAFGARSGAELARRPSGSRAPHRDARRADNGFDRFERNGARAQQRRLRFERDDRRLDSVLARCRRRERDRRDSPNPRDVLGPGRAQARRRDSRSAPPAAAHRR